MNAPNWLSLAFSADGGPWLGEPGVTISGEELRLDQRPGVLWRRFLVTDPAGRRTSVSERRLVSMADPRAAATETHLVAENWSGLLRVRSRIDRSCCTAQTAESHLLSHCHLVLTGTGQDPGGVAWLAARTSQSGVLIATAVRTIVSVPSHAAVTDQPVAKADQSGLAGVAREYVTWLAEGARCRVEKVAAIYTSFREHRIVAERSRGREHRPAGPDPRHRSSIRIAARTGGCSDRQHPRRFRRLHLRSRLRDLFEADRAGQVGPAGRALAAGDAGASESG